MAGGKDSPTKDEKAEVDEAMTAAAEKSEDEPTYHVDEHMELSYGMYDEPAHVVAGALELIPGNKKNFTKAEIAAAIKAFKKHKVVVDTGPDEA